MEAHFLASFSSAKKGKQENASAMAADSKTLRLPEAQARNHSQRPAAPSARATALRWATNGHIAGQDPASARTTSTRPPVSGAPTASRDATAFAACWATDGPVVAAAAACATTTTMRPLSPAEVRVQGAPWSTRNSPPIFGITILLAVKCHAEFAERRD